MPGEIGRDVLARKADTTADLEEGKLTAVLQAAYASDGNLQHLCDFRDGQQVSNRVRFNRHKSCQRAAQASER